VHTRLLHCFAQNLGLAGLPPLGHGPSDAMQHEPEQKD
jgi:hypothetical protein